MSLVGTRPPTVDEWELYEPHHRARMSFRPGLTGMWQVSGRSNITDFECILLETVLPGLCDFTYSVPNPVKPQSLDESFIRCHGWLGHLGDCEWRTEADHRVHREGCSKEDRKRSGIPGIEEGKGGCYIDIL